MARILVVDDDRDVRTLVTTLLTEEGHAVDEAEGGRQALQMMAKETPDICVLDLMMPTMDGFSVLKEMKAKGFKRKVKVLILTAKAAESDWVRGYRLGADTYLTKPFDPDELINAIKVLQDNDRDELQRRRQRELEMAELLSRVESIFDR
jgi:DNA-binding response OmpR family regulator